MDNELKNYEVQKNPNDFLLKRREITTSIFSQIQLLINRNIEEARKYNEKVLYSFPLKSLVFSDESDLLKFEEDIEVNSGIFQLKSVNIINIEQTEDGIKCTQKIGISFIKNWRDFSFKRNFAFENGDPYHFKFKEAENFPVVFDAEKVLFLDDKNCIYNESNSFYFVSKLKYEAIKSFILDTIADLN